MKPNSKALIMDAAQWAVAIVAAFVLLGLGMFFFNWTVQHNQPVWVPLAEAADGTYSAVTQGFGGEVSVAVTLGGGKITDVKIVGDNETPGLGGRAVDEMPAQFLAAQAMDVDGISGATISSTAIRAAFSDALALANVDAAALVKQENPVVQETPAQTEAAAGSWVALTDVADGTYSATEKGFGGEIVVDVTLGGGKITDVKIVGDSETPGLGAVAVEQMPAQFLAAQAMDVDGVSGATVSSNAIRKAFSAALAQANVDASALVSAASAQQVEKTAEILEADVVVIGAGGAGMTAAITAKQAGMNVIVLEKMPYVGGNTTKASGGMNAAGTKFQEAAIAAETDEKTRESLEGSTVENFIVDTMAGGHEINDPQLVRRMAESSSDAIDWLESIGAPLPKIAATGGTVHMYLHEPEDGSAVGEYLVQRFSAQLEAMQIPVYLETQATNLISKDGTVTGVLAEGKDKIYVINAKAVILATGGFGANEEMYCSYRPDLKGTVTTNAPGATGDGILMAQSMGADLVDIDQIQLHPTVFQENGFLVSERLRSNGAILVNLNGQRFTNDLATRDAVSAAELTQPECCAFIVYDSQFAEEKLYKKYVTNGLTVQGDTLEELAAAMGFDTAATENFVATVAKWNETVKNGTADEFGRNNGLVSLDQAPYYAIQIAPGIHHTMGGVKIDTDTHVIDTNGNQIPGLYAAGEVTGGVHGGNRIGGNAVADIVVYGRIAGQMASEYVNTSADAHTGATQHAEEPAGQVGTATAKGFGGDITVTVTVADGKVTDVKIVGDNETPGLGGRAVEEMPTQFLAAQSAEVDGVAGATISSNAIRTAFSEALAQANAGASAPAAEAAVPTASRANGVITADEWEAFYPEITATYKATGENTYIVDYLEQDPYLVSLYEGYGFAKQYGSARGHAYCLEDLAETARPHALANCLTCKTADFTKLVNDLGTEAYSMDFGTVFADMSENVGCYTCHGNEADQDGKLVVTHDYIIDKLGDNMSSIDAATLSCGQCHIEYYFEPDTKATTVPYSDTAGMDPTAILAYYDAIGFSDWTQPSTGTGLLKAQHPEMETYLNGSVHASFGMSCASCHMEKVTGEDGTTYTSHDLVSPLESEAILQSCAACHRDVDMTEKVHAIQEQVTARETEVGNALAGLKEKLAEAVASGAYSEEELNAIRQVYRSAQWYFDFDYVENSEGAHNSRLANSCLDKAQELITQGMGMFKAA